MWGCHMNEFLFFVHALGAVGMGIYLILPFIVGRITQLNSEGQAGFGSVLMIANRFAQYFLIVQLLTGGYMMTLADYSVLWMVLTTALFVAIGAVSGMMGGPLKRISAAVKAGESPTSHIARVRTFSVLLLVLYVAIIFVMQYPAIGL